MGHSIADRLEASILTEDGKPDWKLKLKTLPKNTRDGYESRLRMFDKFMAKRFPDLNPERPHDKHLALFLISEYRRGVSGSTLKASSNAVNWRASAMGWDKVSGPYSNQALKGLGREAVRRGRGQAPSLDQGQIDHLIETVAQAGNAWSHRDSAIISTTYYGTLRISEALALDREQVRFLPSGEAELSILRSKTDQAGEGATVLIPKCAAAYLRAWIEFAGIESGPVFRSIQYAGFGETRVSGIRGRLSYYQANRMLKARAKRAGLGRVTTHSLRRSHTRVLAERGATDMELGIIGRWSSGSMAKHYAVHALSHSIVMRKFYPPRLKLRAVKSA